MFVRKLKGPRVVRLPDGGSISVADLPKSGTTRWVASRKAVVAKAVKYGLIAAEEAIARYDLSREELQGWIGAIDRHGAAGLKITRMHDLRTGH
ncbi:DUF1153 domain-containing protein [Fluviibacterium sp. S390]|uniref:CtrA inhibitor SciP n=1 Tax=Fluviibacterium sp. S390 TaxID=3415139 RepID=UPI003C7D6213